MGNATLYLGSGSQTTYDKTSTYTRDGTLVKAIKVIDEDDPTKISAGVAGPPVEDYEWVRLEDLKTYVGYTPHVFSVQFPDRVIITPSGKDKIIVPYGQSGNTIQVVGLQLNANKVGTTGNTICVVCDKNIAAADTTNSISATMASTAVTKQATGSFTITVGASLYVWLSSTAFHEDVMASIICKEVFA